MRRHEFRLRLTFRHEGMGIKVVPEPRSPYSKRSMLAVRSILQKQCKR